MEMIKSQSTETISDVSDVLEFTVEKCLTSTKQNN